MSCKYCEPWRIFVRDRHSADDDLRKASILANETTSITIEPWPYENVMAAELFVEIVSAIEQATVRTHATVRTRIDFCPWCGEELKAVEW